MRKGTKGMDDRQALNGPKSLVIRKAQTRMAGSSNTSFFPDWRTLWGENSPQDLHEYSGRITLEAGPKGQMNAKHIRWAMFLVDCFNDLASIRQSWSWRLHSIPWLGQRANVGEVDPSLPRKQSFSFISRLLVPGVWKRWGQAAESLP